MFTHDAGIAAWDDQLCPEIQPIRFGAGESTAMQARLDRAGHEWAKGGRIIDWLKAQDIRAVALGGYNDVGRLRIIRWCARVGLPCLLYGDSNIDGDSATGWKARVKQRLLPPILRRCAAVLPCGHRGRAYFERYGVEPARTFFFPYEPDYRTFEAVDPIRQKAVVERLELSQNRRRFVFCARLAPEKRPDLALDAFAAIADRRPDWDLVIVGTGPLENHLRDRMLPGIRDRILWAGFVGDSYEVAAIYRASDVLILPSDYEPWAVVVNEAAATGLALVCSAVVGAAAELLRDGVNGRSFPPGDLPALTECLLDVSHPTQTDRMKQASAEVLQQWRLDGDPVAGLRKALEYVGVI